MIVCANQNKMCVGKEGNAMSKLCTSHATKILLVNDSDESVGGTRGWRKGKWMMPRNETFSDIFKLKKVCK